MSPWKWSGVGAGALLASFGLAVGGSHAGASSLPAGCGQSGTTVTCTFSDTGAEQTFTVPTGVTSLSAQLVGASGADTPPTSSENAGREDNSYQIANGGLGGVVTTTLTVVAGQTLFVEVGGEGSGTNGGFNGGAAGGTDSVFTGETGADGGGGGGGGASDIRTVSRSADGSLASRLAVAGGGGGAGAPGFADGGWAIGGAGGNAGADGTTPGDDDSGQAGGGGGGGTATNGGAGGTGASIGDNQSETAGADGTAGSESAGGAGSGSQSDAGGGGGGCFGGGGGGGGTGEDGFTGPAGGAGGGSSCIGPVVAAPAGHLQTRAISVATSAGPGRVVLTYSAPAAVTTTTTAASTTTTTVAATTTTTVAASAPAAELPATGARDVGSLLGEGAASIGLGSVLVFAARRRHRPRHGRR